MNFDDLKNDFDKRTFNFEQDKYQLSESNPRLLNWLGSINYSGYIREESLKYLINNYQLGDENRILLRLEDWVSKIQGIAFEWTKNNFHKLSLEQINRNHKLILYLSRKQKLQNSEAINIIKFSLTTKVNNTDRDTFFSLNEQFRKFLYLTTLPLNSASRNFIIEDKDPNNRILLLKLFQFSQLRDREIALLKQDKCSSIKRRFIYYRLEQNIIIDKSELIQLAQGNRIKRIERKMGK